jgi:hypothetical protein
MEAMVWRNKKRVTRLAIDRATRGPVHKRATDCGIPIADFNTVTGAEVLVIDILIPLQIRFY